MANTTISPNMNLPVPVPGEDPGPDWANNIVADMYAIDSHNHSSGQGVQITPSGLNINADLSVGSNNLTAARTVRFTSQAAPLAAAADVGCLYESGADLYYNDGVGNQVRITQSGSVTGSSGTITGLPSGTASASFAAGTFSFKSATNTPATMAVGPLVVGSATASPHTVTIAPSASQAADYSLTLPLVAPGANQVPVSDGSGNLSWTYGLLPIGSVVATFPNLTGAYSTVATTAADTRGFVLCQGQTIVDATSPMNGQVVPNINNGIFLRGASSAGGAGGQTTVTIATGNLPSHTHTFTSSTSVANSSHTHNMAHMHQWAHITNSGFNSQLFSIVAASSSPANTTITGANDLFLDAIQGQSGSGRSVIDFVGAGDYYTTGALSAPGGAGSSAATGTPSATTTVSGTTNATGSGTALNILPDYIETVYLMRIK